MVELRNVFVALDLEIDFRENAQQFLVHEEVKAGGDARLEDGRPDSFIQS